MSHQLEASRRPRRPAGLRVRITATIAVIIFVAVSALGAAVHVLVVQDRISEARSAADGRVRAAMDIYDSTGLLSFDATTDDAAVPRDLRRELTGNGARATKVSGGSTRTLWAAGRTQGKIISIQETFSPVDDSVQSLDRALIVAGLVTVLVASLAGAVSANRLSRRLGLAARTARVIAAGDGERRPSLRQAVGRGADEVGDLADAVDAMAERLAERLRSEQQFTADVAHDLRTPVTGLLTAAALLDDSRPAELVRNRADALAGLVEELLEIARLDSGVETAELVEVQLDDLVARAVARGVGKGEFAAGSVAVQPVPLSDPSPVRTDPRRVERLLSNLIRNATQHGRPPVELAVTGRRITVSDHGPGFSDTFLQQGPQRFRRGTGDRRQGHGLGLIIAVGQARVLGAQLHFANAEGGGAVITVDLPLDAREHRTQPHVVTPL